MKDGDDQTSTAKPGVVTSIVLPAYNEAGNLEPLIEELLETVADPEMEPYRPVEMIFVDDGSTDESRSILRDLASESNAIMAVFLRRNFGQSAALAAGIDQATGRYVVTMDADGQNNPADVPSLLANLEEGYDCVSGWRKRRNDPVFKTIPSKFQTYLTSATGPDIHDFGCTLKAYRASALDTVDLYGEGHRYIPAKLYKHGFDITEQVVDHRPRTAGRTKYGWRRLLKGAMDLLFHAFWNRYSSRPLHILGGLGFLSMLVGLTIGLHGLVMKYAFGVELAPHLPRLVLTVGLVLFGLQLVMFGLLAEMLTKLYYSEHDAYDVAAVIDAETAVGDTAPNEQSRVSTAQKRSSTATSGDTFAGLE